MSEHGRHAPTNCRSSQLPENWSGETIEILPTILWMPAESPAEFKRGFIARVRKAREATGWNQREMAEALHIPLKNYESYESRSLLPHWLIAQFCRVARVSIEYLFVGRLPTQQGRKRPSDPQPSSSRQRHVKQSRIVSDKLSEKHL